MNTLAKSGLPGLTGWCSMAYLTVGFMLCGTIRAQELPPTIEARNIRLVLWPRYSKNRELLFEVSLSE
jgi:hypothetical protein